MDPQRLNVRDRILIRLRYSPQTVTIVNICVITTTFNMRSPGIRLHKLILFAWAVVITAVLLLLSLPVLAGKLNLPALNLAVFWEPVYEYISQSAGNLLNLNFLENLRGHTPKYFGCSLEFLTFPNFFFVMYKLKKKRNVQLLDLFIPTTFIPTTLVKNEIKIFLVIILPGLLRVMVQ